MHVRISTEMEYCCGSLEAEDLAFRNVAVLTMLVETQEERVHTAIRIQTLPRKDHVFERICCKNVLDDLVRQNLVLRRELDHRNPREHTVPALQLDLRLD